METGSVSTVAALFQGYVTVTDTVFVRVLPPPVPLIVIVNVPVEANLDAFNVRVDCPPGATGFFENEAVTQIGNPETESVTALENPATEATATVTAACPFLLTDTAAGVAASVKSGAELTTRVTWLTCVTTAELPLIVSG